MIIVIFLAALAILYSAWALTVRIGLKSLSCTRAFSRPAVFAGEEGELIEVVRNDRPFMIPWLQVESRISQHLRLGSQDNLHVSGQMYYSSLFTLMPYQQIRRRHKVQFLHRGAFDLGNASLTAGDMLGLYRSQRTQELSVPVLVYPKLMEDALPASVSRVLGEMAQRRQLLQDPFLVRGIRAYQPGDPVRDIHWPATARTGDVQVRVRDYTARIRLLVVLNAQSEDLQWRNHLSERDEARLEYGITLAASVCVRTLREGFAVGFAANMPLDKGSESTLMLPAEGADREEALLTAFARLNILRTENFPAFLDSLNSYSGLDILVLSLYDSDSIQTAIRKLERSGNQVTFHEFQGGGGE